jgi:hypothetical protein
MRMQPDHRSAYAINLVTGWVKTHQLFTNIHKC